MSADERGNGGKGPSGDPKPPVQQRPSVEVPPHLQPERVNFLQAPGNTIPYVLQPHYYHIQQHQTVRHRTLTFPYVDHQQWRQVAMHAGPVHFPVHSAGHIRCFSSEIPDMTQTHGINSQVYTPQSVANVQAEQPNSNGTWQTVIEREYSIPEIQTTLGMPLRKSAPLILQPAFGEPCLPSTEYFNFEAPRFRIEDPAKHASEADLQSAGCNRVPVAYRYTAQYIMNPEIRHPASVFEQPQFTEICISSILKALPLCISRSQGREYDCYNQYDRTLVVGGDGRYLTEASIVKAIKLAAGSFEQIQDPHNPLVRKLTRRVNRVVVGKNGVLSASAAALLVTSRQAMGGVYFTAGHRPGGPQGEFGIRVLESSGAPARDSLMNLVTLFCQTCASFMEYPTDLIEAQINLSVCQEYSVAPGFTLEVVDSVEEYTNQVKKIFDFKAIKHLRGVFKPDFTFSFDAMHGASGPYAERIFIDELGMPDNFVVNSEPKADFNRREPNPNLSAAKYFLETSLVRRTDLAVACSGDGGRCLIVGQNGYNVAPGDNAAVIAAWAPRVLPTLAQGLARTANASRALDMIALAQKTNLYETEPGWRNFAHLAQTGKAGIFVDQAFGIGFAMDPRFDDQESRQDQTHAPASAACVFLRDGICGALAWLQILAQAFADARSFNLPASQNPSVHNLLLNHWGRYGRHYAARMEYHRLNLVKLDAYFANLRKITGPKLAGWNAAEGYTVSSSFELAFYESERDKKFKSENSLVVLKPFIIVNFDNGSRLVVRKSLAQETALCVHLERYVPSGEAIDGPERVRRYGRPPDGYEILAQTRPQTISPHDNPAPPPRLDGSVSMALATLSFLAVSWTGMTTSLGVDAPDVYS